MAKVLVLYYSKYGQVETRAKAVAEGARGVAGTEASIKRVPELMPEDAARKAGVKLDQPAPIATVDERASYDPIIFGVPTRFGNMAAQMRNFLDQTGGHWMKGSLIGKVGSVFTSTATQHGGQETTITSFHHTLLHQGMIIVGVPYSCQELMNMSEITGGSPHCARTPRKNDRPPPPSGKEVQNPPLPGAPLAPIPQKQAGQSAAGPPPKARPKS